MMVVCYKCRRCQRIVKGAEGPDDNVKLAVQTVVITGEPYESDKLSSIVAMVRSHVCNDASMMGVLDLIGAQELPQPPF